MPRAALALGLALTLAAALAGTAAPAEPELLVTVGEVTDTSAVVWVRGVDVGGGHGALRAGDPGPRRGRPRRR